MRISEMTTEQAFECMARMVPYVTEIERDQEVVNVKEKLREAAKQEDGDLTTGDVIEATMPLILEKHRNAFFGSDCLRWRARSRRRSPSSPTRRQSLPSRLT